MARWLTRTEASLVAKGRCVRCCLKVCICAEVMRIGEATPPHFPGQIDVFTHPHETGRSSNSGKLLRLLGPKTSVFLAGTPDEERLIRELRAAKVDGAAPFLLFPSSSAAPLGQFLADHWRIAPGAPQQQRRLRPIRAVLIDAKWSKARRLAQRVPAELAPRVRLVTARPLSRCLTRAQGSEGRLMTVDAAVALCNEMGVVLRFSNGGNARSAAALAVEAMARALENATDVLNGAYARQYSCASGDLEWLMNNKARKRLVRSRSAGSSGRWPVGG